MQVTVQDLGAFFRALGEQMIDERDVCAGAILDNPESRAEIVKRMSEPPRGAPDTRYYAEVDVADAIVGAAYEGQGDVFAEWVGAFGDIDIPD